MATETFHRKLAAIFYADVAGYSRLTEADEEGTHRRLSEYLDTVSLSIESHNGKVVHYAGDAVLADFATGSDALACASSVQKEIAVRNGELPTERQIRFRIGINVGEVIVDRSDIYGEGVNIAARLESIAEPGGICISGTVYDAIGTKMASLYYEYIGEQSVKNIEKPVRAYRVVTTSAGSQAPPPCPYPGMVPFAATDAQFFYGRDVEIKQMIQLLRRQRFFMVIGPSGSGKSSLVIAGLLPELEKSRYFGEKYWLIRTMRPGQRPHETLTDLIDKKNNCVDNEGIAIEHEIVQKLLNAHPPAQRLLLLVDQFEETFTQAEREQRDQFIAALQPSNIPENCAVVLTLRADFYPDLMTSHLWPVDASQRIEVAPLRGEALRAAIEKPAKDVGVRIEQSLVNQLLADAADEPGALPLLQETMGLLWDEMDQRTLLYETYQQLGVRTGHQSEPGTSGLAVAIATKADTTLGGLNTSGQAIARRIFLRLVQFGEGRADTRRQQPVSALSATIDDPNEFERTLEHLTSHRLLTRSGGSAEKNDPYVDIAHESLISSWTRFQDWIVERREAEQIRRRLEGKIREWERLGQGNGGLLDQAELPEAERWLSSPDAADLGYHPNLPTLVNASQLAIAQAEQAREAARKHALEHAKALVNEQKLRETAQTRTIAQLLIIQALQQQEINLDERSALLARQSFLLSTHTGQRLKEQIDGALRTISSKPLTSMILWEIGSTHSVAFNPVGRFLASVHITTGEVMLWDLTHPGTPPTILPGWPGEMTEDGLSVGAIYALTFSPDGKFLFAGNEDGASAQWDLEQLDTPPVNLENQETGIGSAAFSPDGRFLAVGNRQESTARLWRRSHLNDRAVVLRTGPEVASSAAPGLNQPGGVPVTFSPDNAILASGSLSGTITLWDPGKPDSLLKHWQGHNSAVLALAFSPDGKTLASGSHDGVIRHWDLNNLNAPFNERHTDGFPVYSVAFSPDGETLSACGDWGIKLWSMQESNDTPEVLTGWVNKVEFSPDGKYLASAGLNGGDGLRLWDLAPTRRPTILSGHQKFALSLAFSPNGEILASGGDRADKNILLWDMTNTHSPPRALEGIDGWVSSVAFNSDSTQLLSASNDSIVRIWTLGNPTTEKTRIKIPNPWCAQFDPTGNTLASGSLDGHYMWDVSDLTAEPEIYHLTRGWVSEIAFSPDGKTLAVAADGDAIIRLQQLDDPNSPPLELHGHEQFAWSLSFSPDGNTLASGGKDTTVRLWDLRNPQKPSMILGHHDDEVLKVRFSPNGKQLATSSVDRSVRLWHLEEPNKLPIVLNGHEREVWSLAFSPDSEILASGSNDIRLWDLTDPLLLSSTAELADYVCKRVWRNLTLDEWHKFVGEDIPYERTCPDLPIHESVIEAAEKRARAGDLAALEDQCLVDP